MCEKRLEFNQAVKIQYCVGVWGCGSDSTRVGSENCGMRCWRDKGNFGNVQTAW